MSCGQGGAKWLASESRLLQARFAMLRCVHKCRCRRARTEGADGRYCSGGGMHGCMARKRSVWGSVAGHVCAAAGLGATGEERRRTRTSTGRSSCRSMHHERDVDLGLEDVQIGVDEPPEKKPRVAEVVLASCLAGLGHGPADPEISRPDKARKSSKTKHNCGHTFWILQVKCIHPLQW